MVCSWRTQNDALTKFDTEIPLVCSVWPVVHTRQMNSPSLELTTQTATSKRLNTSFKT